MRTSRKRQIVEAAIALVDAHGLESLSFEVLSEHTEISKSGVIYHFPTKHALLTGMHTYLAEAWHEEMLELSGGVHPQELSPKQRLEVIARTMAISAPKVLMIMATESRSHPDFTAPWRKVELDWLPNPAEATSDDEHTAIYLAMLASDGLWVHDYLHPTPLDIQTRWKLYRAIIDRL